MKNATQQNESEEQKSNKSARQANREIIPDFHLFGHANDLDFFGDEEELYASSQKPSTR